MIISGMINLETAKFNPNFHALGDVSRIKWIKTTYICLFEIQHMQILMFKHTLNGY